MSRALAMPMAYSYEAEARDLAEEYVGRPIADAEWQEAREAAADKQTRIIDQFGDSAGERRKPYYFAQLAVEHIRATALSRIFRG